MKYKTNYLYFIGDYVVINSIIEVGIETYELLTN